MKYICFLFVSSLILSCNNSKFDVRGKWKVRIIEDSKLSDDYDITLVTNDSMFFFYSKNRGEDYGVPIRISNDTIFDDLSALEELYWIFRERKILTNETTRDQFSRFDDTIKQDLYNLSTEKGMFNETSFDTYKTIWTEKKVNIKTFDTIQITFSKIIPITNDSVKYILYVPKYDDFTSEERASIKLGETIFDISEEIWTR